MNFMFDLLGVLVGRGDIVTCLQNNLCFGFLGGFGRRVGSFLERTNPIAAGLKKKPTMPGFREISPITFRGAADKSGILNKQFRFADRKRGEFEKGLQDRARLGTGELSAEAQALADQQQLGQTGLESRLGQQAATQAAQQQQALSLRGGSTAAGRERLGARLGQQAVLGRQQLGQEGEQSRLGIRAQDLQSRVDLRSRLAGQEGREIKSDITRGQADLQQRNQFNLQQQLARAAQTTQEDVAKRAAFRQEHKSGIFGGGGVLGSGLGKGGFGF